jgi:seryl-tRNA synthetase
VRKLARRGHDLDLPGLDKLFTRHIAAVGAVDEVRAEANRAAKEISASAKRGEDVTARREHARSLKSRIQELEETRQQSSAELEEFLLGAPNLPADDLPDGDSEKDADLVATWGTMPSSTSNRPTTWRSGSGSASSTSVALPSCPGRASPWPAEPAPALNGRSRTSCWTCTPSGTATPSSRYWRW